MRPHLHSDGWLEIKMMGKHYVVVFFVGMEINCKCDYQSKCIGSFSFTVFLLRP